MAVASKANFTAAQLAGVQGKIRTAEGLVDKAVEQKYGALEEERKVKIENLELLLKDPTLSVEQKERAEKQKKAQEKEKAKEDQKKDDAKEISKLGIELIKVGATDVASQVFAEAQTDNPNLAKVAKISASFLKKEDLAATAGSLEEFKLIMGRAPVSLRELNEFTASRAEAGRKGEVQKSDQFSKARQFLSDNPSASRAELKAGLLEHSTDLSVTDIDAVLDEAGVKEITNIPDEQLESIALSLVAGQFETAFFQFAGTEMKKAQDKAKQLLEATGGTIKVNNKTLELSPQQIETLRTKIEAVKDKKKIQERKSLFEK